MAHQRQIIEMGDPEDEEFNESSPTPRGESSLASFVGQFQASLTQRFCKQLELFLTILLGLYSLLQTDQMHQMKIAQLASRRRMTMITLIIIGNSLRRVQPALVSNRHLKIGCLIVCIKWLQVLRHRATLGSQSLHRPLRTHSDRFRDHQRMQECEPY
jgi:hypothetical protein